jgi:trans-aconitate methyltransferase
MKEKAINDERLDTPHKRLKASRIEAGFKTAKLFIEQYGLKQSTYSAHESGKNKLSVEQAEFYAKLLNISASWLIMGETSTNLTAHSKFYPLESKVFEVNGFIPANHRLDFLQAIHGPDSIQFLEMIGIKNSRHVIDVGCYNGGMTMWIADQIENNGHITGLHDDVEVLNEAIINANKYNLTNVKFSHFNPSNFSKTIANENIDLIYSRYLLHRLVNPLKTLEQIIKCMNVGTRLILEDCTHSYFEHFPKNKSFDLAKDLMMAASAKLGLDFDIGNKIYSYVRSFGLTVEHIKATQPVANKFFEKRMLEYITTYLGEQYVQQKLITQKKLDALVKQLQDLAEEDSIVYYTRTTQICAKK